MVTKEEAIKGSIKHWQKMIRWAKKQSKGGRTHKAIMADAINEDWDGCFCGLCDKYYDKYSYDNCIKCPLSKKFGGCSSDEPHDNLWEEVAESMTWGTWVKRAEKFLEQLKKLS